MARTFVHLSSTEEIETFAREVLGIQDIVHYPWGFQALNGTLDCVRGERKRQSLPSVSISGVYGEEDAAVFEALKKAFAVPRKKVVESFLGPDFS